MGQVKEETQGDTTRLRVFSIPDVILETVGTPPDGNPIVEILPGILLIGAGQPLWQVDRPYLKLFNNLGIEPEEIIVIPEKGGYFNE